MRLAFDSRRKARGTLERAHPGAAFIDVTSKAGEPWVRLSPFFPHGDIPVPFSNGVRAASVEGIWQGLKVFEGADIDVAKFNVRSMSGIKRSVRKHGRVLGHRRGVGGELLLPYLEARRTIYLPSYRFVLEHRVAELIANLKRQAETQPVVLLDYETNGNVQDLASPLSHAALIVMFAADVWP